MHRQKPWITGGAILIVLLIASSLMLDIASGTQPHAPDDDFWSYIPFVSQGEPAATATRPPSPSPTASPQPTGGPTSTRPPAGSIVVDHTSVALFEQIPEQYLNAAANLRMLFIDRSVGHNISLGLDCLSYPTDEQAPNHCSRYEHIVPAYSLDPSEVNWSRPGGYNRSNWDYLFWEGDCGSWFLKVECFMNMVSPVINQYDVVSFQFSYLEVGDHSDVSAQSNGYFANNPDRTDVHDQEAFEAQHANKVFIYWTSSLARGIGTTVARDFNNQMRQYAISNDKPLFDVADILSHTPDGQPCYDNRDGVPYLSENYPDDGQNLPAICQHYTTETDGGHLGQVSAGKIRVAKAFWVLMARIAGWDGVSQ